MPSIDTIVVFREVGFCLQIHMFLLYLRRLQLNEFAQCMYLISALDAMRENFCFNLDGLGVYCRLSCMVQLGWDGVGTVIAGSVRSAKPWSLRLLPQPPFLALGLS